MLELLATFNQHLSLSYNNGLKNFDALEKAKFGESFLLFLTSGEGEEHIRPEKAAELWYGQADFYNFREKGLNTSKSLTAKIGNSILLLFLLGKVGSVYNL